MTHAVSGRQKKSSRADTKSQGVYPSTTAKITIADLLHTVKSTHQSILSQDVLRHIGGVKDPSSYYAQQVKYSSQSGAVSDRAMLVDLFEQMVTDSNEYKALQNYKKNIDRMLALEEKIDRLNEEIKRASYEDGVKNAEYSTPDYAGDPNVYRWNYFYTPVEVEGGNSWCQNRCAGYGKRHRWRNT